MITALDLTAADRARLNSGVEGILLKSSFDPAHLVLSCPSGSCKRTPQEFVGDGVVTKILYVEDNDDNVYMMRMQFELLDGFEFLTAEDGEARLRQGQSRIARYHSDGPRLAGVQRLGSNPDALKTMQQPGTYLSLHSPHTRWRALADQALAAGCDEFDTKPINFQRLLEKVDLVLGSGRRNC